MGFPSEVLQVKWLIAILLICGCAAPSSAPKKKWVWYAPYFNNGTTPNDQQMGYYFSRLKDNGIEPIGVDIGESFGSPQGNAIFDTYYESLIKDGYESSGCMILQSRGGLMGYTWALKNQDKIRCVLGIYPLTTVEDYVGVNVIAPAWGVTPIEMLSRLSEINPLDRASEISFPVLHIHGDSDPTVPIAASREFVTRAHGEMIEVPGQGHEYYSDEFFHNERAFAFLLNAYTKEKR